ncbi:MAG TPA: hypothetical protein VHX44_00075 [Planctomycetota bacterium]|nr:hypothetical protein [Planctomycetota bacterium]
MTLSKSVVLLCVSLIYGAILTAADSDLPKPQLSSHFGLCVQVKGVITETKTGDYKAFEPFISLTVPADTARVGTPKPIQIKVFGHTSQLEKELKSDAVLNRLVEVIGYETFRFHGLPEGMANFPELDPLRIADVGWSVDHYFVIMHWKISP